MKIYSAEEWEKKQYKGRWSDSPFNRDRVNRGELDAAYIGRRNTIEYDPKHGTCLVTEGFHFLVDDVEGKKYFNQSGS